MEFVGVDSKIELWSGLLLFICSDSGDGFDPFSEVDDMVIIKTAGISTRSTITLTIIATIKFALSSNHSEIVGGGMLSSIGSSTYFCAINFSDLKFSFTVFFDASVDDGETGTHLQVGQLE